MKYQGIFFDYDYTLGDATEAIVAGFLYGLHTMGYPIPTREAIRNTVGLVLQDGFTQITGEHNQEKRAEFSALYRKICTPAQIATAQLNAGAAELLAWLKEQGAALSVVSSKPAPILVDILKNQEIYEYFDRIIGPDMVSAPKPDPEGILRAVKEANLSKSDVLYCGDTIIDAQAAQNAGVSFCAVLNGTTPAEAFAPYPSAFIAEDLGALHRWLKEG